MRIISGTCKGRRLFSPEGTLIRPTGDKVKGAVFSMIREYLEHSTVLDLFAGTGSLGLEALSRGAAKCYFCDNSSDSIRLLRKNINLCAMSAKSEILFSGFDKALDRVKESLDLIFLDPPYDKQLYAASLEAIRDTGSLNQSGVVVVEYQTDSAMPDFLEGFIRLSEKHYGRTRIALFSPGS